MMLERILWVAVSWLSCAVVIAAAYRDMAV